ncbi:MAG: HAD-IIA family hydrolase, partial [Candidatus Micrarchaeota archaeon]
MIKAVIFDLDGTLFLGKTAIPGAAKKLEELRSKGIKMIFLTNAATRSRENLLEKILSMGLSAQKDEIYCSSYFLAKYISEFHKGKTVYIVGEQGINDELGEHGIRVVDEKADIVTVGLDRGFTYEKLANALKQLQNGAILLSSNKDTTYPTEHGVMPGAGSIVAAVEAASGKEAISLGKP